MTISHLKGRFASLFFSVFRGKYLLFILIILAVTACNRDVSYREIEISFNKFLNSLQIEDISQAEKFVPFLSDTNVEERHIILESFRTLNDMDYDLEISKISDNIFHLRIITTDPNSIWSGITIPYQQNKKGLWVMASVIESVQFIDIIPVEN